MLMTPFNFRQMLIYTYILGLCAAFYDLIFWPNMPPAISSVVAENASKMSDEELVSNIAITVIGLVVSIVVTVGMFNFRTWARKISMLSVLMGTIFNMKMGPQVTSGIGSTFLYLSTFASGMCLAIAYYEPTISDKFNSAKTVY